MTGVDKFAVELALDGVPMNLRGVDLEAAALALADRGESYTEIALRCRSNRKTVARAVDAARQRARRATS